MKPAMKKTRRRDIAIAENCHPSSHIHKPETERTLRDDSPSLDIETLEKLKGKEAGKDYIIVEHWDSARGIMIPSVFWRVASFVFLVCTIFAMPAQATEVEIETDGERGIIEVTTHARFDVDALGRTGGTLVAPGGSKHFTTEEGVIVSTYDTTAIRPGDDCRLYAYAVSDVSQHRAESEKTFEPNNNPTVSIAPTEWRGNIPIEVSYSFPRSSKAQGRINLYYLYGEKWVTLMSFPAIPLSATHEAAGSISKIIDTTLLQGGELNVKADAVLYYTYEECGSQIITATNKPTIDCEITQTNDTTLSLKITYSFPSTTYAQGNVSCYFDGERVLSESIFLSQDGETQSSVQKIIDTNGYEDGTYELRIIAYLGEHVREAFYDVLIKSQAIERVDKSFEVPRTKQTRAGDPINVANGNMDLRRTDLKLAAPGIPLTLERTYMSQSDYEGIFGYGWQTNYEARLKFLSHDEIAYIDHDGVWTYFLLASDGSYTASCGKVAHLTEESGGTFLVQRKHGMQYRFSDSGQLMSIRDRNDNEITCEYDTNGDLVAVRHSNGKTFSFFYHNGHVVSVRDSAGREVLYAYDGFGNLAAVTDPLGNTAYFAYDDEHNMVTKIDRNGSEYFYNYDAYDRATSFWQPGNVNRIDLVYGEGETAVTDSLGTTTTYAFNEYGLVHTICDALGNTRQIGWDDAMNKTYEVNEKGATTEFAYDEHGNLICITDPVGAVTSLVYAPEFDVPLERIDALGNTTTYRYDRRGNLVHIRDALGNETKYTYDDWGNMRSATNARGATTEFRYDEAGNCIMYIDALGNQTTYTYDAVGRMTSITDPRGNMTAFDYDDLGRQRAVIYADGTRVYFQYDNEGNEIHMTDAQGSETSFEYDFYNRLEKVTNALEHVLQYTYDSESNTIATTSPSGARMTYSYDALHRLVSEVTACAKHKAYEYDPAGNMCAKVNGNGERIQYEYDERGLLEEIVYPDGSGVRFTYDELGRRVRMEDDEGTTTYGYDKLGRVVMVDGPSDRDRIQYAYDALGNRIQMINQDGSEVSYEYDRLDRLIRIAYSADSRMDYYRIIKNNKPSHRGHGDWGDIKNNNSLGAFCARHATINEKNSECISGETIVEYSYDAVSNLTRVQYANGTSCEYTYDNRNRIKTVTHFRMRTDGEREVISSFFYTYDTNGMRVRTDLADGTWIEYGYDALGRLLSEMKKKCDAQGNEVSLYAYEYSYDEDGNRLSMERRYERGIFWDYYGPHLVRRLQRFLRVRGFGDCKNRPRVASPFGGGGFASYVKAFGKRPIIKTSYKYTADNELVRLDEDLRFSNAVFDIKDVEFAYDGEGNLIQTTDNRHETTDFEYDYENHLTSVIARSGSDEAISTYAYDGSGKRIRVTEKTDNRLQVTEYLYDGLLPVIERNSNGETTASYVRNPNAVGGIGSLVSMRVPKNKKGLKTLYYHYDGSGNVVGLTGKRGFQNARYSYDAFGNTLRVRGKWAALNKHRFSTKETSFVGAEDLQPISLVYYGARYYNPEWGRWLTQDPAGMIDGPNRYAFVHNNPVDHVDLWGYKTEIGQRALKGMGKRRGILRHDFIKVTDDVTGQVKTYSFGPENRFPVSNGVVANETDYTDVVWKIVNGVSDDLVIKNAEQSMKRSPGYDLAPGFDLLSGFVGVFSNMNCQEWAQMILNRSKAKC